MPGAENTRPSQAILKHGGTCRVPKETRRFAGEPLVVTASPPVGRGKVFYDQEALHRSALRSRPEATRAAGCGSVGMTGMGSASRRSSATQT